MSYYIGGILIKEFFKNKVVLVIGGTGTIGRKIVEILLGCEPRAIRIFSRDEYKQFKMENELSQHKDKLRFLIGDIRDAERVNTAAKGVDVIFHLAAMKHVPACEYNPFEAVKTNVIGTQNIIAAALSNNVSNVVFTSSDKAISPTNAMGATKLLAERLISSAYYIKGSSNTIFSAVRFGNVMGSRGSVIPLFKKQIVEESKITLTDGEMSRFMMSITEAAMLTIKAMVNSCGGEVFVLKMPIIRMGDMADVVIQMVRNKLGITKPVEIQSIGLRAGEKLYEELLTEEEACNSYELPEMYVILPSYPNAALHEKYKGFEKIEKKSYSSHNQEPISKQEIQEIFESENLI